MSSGEFIGDVTEGALTARALEPAAGESGERHPSEGATCLNCGAALLGPYCHECGQPAHVHRTLGAFFHDLLHGVLHFEGKIWRTLPLVAFRPGKLTREYIEGRRASYISPIALFLFSAFLLYATIHAIGPEAGTVSKGTAASAIAEQQKDFDLAEAQLAGAKDAATREMLEKRIATDRQSIATLDKLGEAGVATGEVGKASDAHSDIPWLEAALKKFRANPELAVYKLQMSAYKYSWLLIPISVPFLWLLFPFSRRFRLYDHTVFVTYSLSFMTLFGVLLTVFDRLGATWLGLPAVLVPPLHMYRQLKGTYALTRMGAFWRTWLLLGFAFAALIAFVSVLLVGIA